jgi:hypothetical protein
MMFMIDAADDERDRSDAGQHGRQRVAHRGGRLEELGLVEDLKVVILGHAQAMLLAQEGADGRLGLLDAIGRGRADGDGAHGIRAGEVLLERRDRDEDLVVRVLESRPALGLEDARDDEGHSPDLDLLAHARRVEAQVVRGGGAQHRDAQLVCDGEVRQPGALPERVGAHRRVVSRGAQDRRRGVGIAVRDELGGGDLGGHAGQGVEAVERLGILERKGLGGPGGPEGEGRLRGTRVDGEQVGAQAGQSIGDIRRRTLARGDERHDGGHA